jgi:regulator of protease activity HflC (stomatin/prohibitin superfamily)
MLDVMLTDSRLRDQLVVLDLNDAQRALVWRDDRLFQIVGPGKHAYWIVPAKLDIETYSVNEFAFKHPRLAAILQHADALKWLDGVQVEDSEEVLLYRDGVLIDTLRKGLHVFWKGTGKVRWKSVDLREQVADVAGQEIITSDKVTLRVNLLVSWQVADPVKAVSTVGDYAQALYREAQLALRAAVGTRQLDALLADKESVGGEVRAALSARTAEFGVVVKSVGLRDIILPGDMKTLLNQVIAAQKEAEANLIRRREETASVRSQANTAKLLAESPALARLKELELLKDVLAGAKTTFVFGSGDIAEQVRGLVTSGKDGD